MTLSNIANDYLETLGQISLERHRMQKKQLLSHGEAAKRRRKDHVGRYSKMDRGYAKKPSAGHHQARSALLE